MQFKKTYSIGAASLAALAFMSQAQAAEDSMRLQPYEPSYLVYRHAQHDENALRARYSFKYSLMPDDESSGGDEKKSGPRSDYRTKHDVFLKYTGEFDFYLRSRASGPVINRMSNPGVHWRYTYPESERPNLGVLGVLQWWNWGVEHRSDGQVTEIKSEEERARVQAAYINGDHAYFDGISRGSNYLSLEAHSTRLIDDSAKLSLYGKTKFYISKDSDITWGPLADKGVSIADYDRVTLTARLGINPYGDTSRGQSKRYRHEISAEWTVGDMALKTDSINLDYMVHGPLCPFEANFCRLDIPWFVRYHAGPMTSLSNYTQFQQYIGFGLKFVP